MERDFWGCCSKEVRDNKEITINFEQRPRAYSQPNSRTAHINRSINKRHLKEEHSKPINTALNLTCTRSTKLISKPSRQLICNTSLDRSQESSRKSSLNKEVHLGPWKKTKKDFEKSFEFRENKVLEQKVNFTALQQMQINTEPPIVQTYAPRLLMQRRIRRFEKQQQLCEISKKNGIIQEGMTIVSPSHFSHLRGQPIKKTGLRSDLEPIEQRLSLPSCSESQVMESRQLNAFTSRSVFNDSRQKIMESSPSHNSFLAQEKFADNSRIVVTAKTQHSNVQSQQKFQNQPFYCNKISIDLTIHQSQLKSLIDQQRLLVQQSRYCQSMFSQKIKNLQQDKGSIQKKISKVEGQIKEMKKMMQKRKRERGIC